MENWMKKKLLGFCWDEVAITCLLLTKFPFGTEIRLSQKNHEGWLVGVWDGNSWDPSQRFRSWSQQNPNRRCSTKLPYFASKAQSLKEGTHSPFFSNLNGHWIWINYHFTSRLKVWLEKSSTKSHPQSLLRTLYNFH